MGLNFDNFNLQNFILEMAVLIIAITIHEFAHAITADRLGDNTPRRQGRISLLPPDHLDPLGTLMMFLTTLTGYGIGWGKPVMTNPGNFRNPRRDGAIVAIAGPISNILQALVYAGIIRLAGYSQFTLRDTPLGTFLYFGVLVNLSLAFFNMIPIAPLDGHWIVTAILPYEQAMSYLNWMRTYGPIVFLGLVLFGGSLLDQVLGPPVVYCYRLLVPLGFPAVLS
jgi:Zn-dependent protease